MTRQRLYIVGRFPPPLDGQTVGTAMLADLLGLEQGGPFDVSRIDVGAPEGDQLVSSVGARLARSTHFWKRRKAVRQELAAFPEAPVLWPSISPSPLGHLRDRVVVATAFQPRQRVFAVLHRGDFDHLFTSPPTRWSGKRLADRLTGFVFNSESLSQRCAEWIPASKRFVVPNTLDNRVAATPEEAQRRTPPPEGRPPHLLYLSGMIPSKGYRDVLEAVGVLHANEIPATATFVGRWPNADAEAAFHARIQSLELVKAVSVLGGISDREQIRQLYLSADLFVLPTTYPIEAQPFTVIEALAAGTPVIVTRHASLPEMIDDGCEGAFVRPHQPADIANAVLRIHPDWQRYSQAARARYMTQFSPSVVQTRWLKILTSADDARTG